MRLWISIKGAQANILKYPIVQKVFIDLNDGGFDGQNDNL